MHEGKIYVSFCPYIDKTTHSIKYKSRPILIIKEPIFPDTEYTVLPVSRVTGKQFLDTRYDVELLKSSYPLLTLTADSYVRTHKQTTMYRSVIDFNKYIGDIKNDYPDTFSKILECMLEWNKEIVNNLK